MKPIQNKPKLRTLVGSVLSLTLLSSQSLVLANPKPASSPNIHPIYKQAQQELPKNYFTVYAIVDRIARANGLDNKPWRIVVTSNYEINAYASDTNLLTFEAGLMDQLEGNASALACAIGHEMGHHVKQHLGYGPAKQEQARLEELQKAEKDKLIAEQDAQTQAALGAGVAVGASQAASAVGGTGGQILGVFGMLLGGAAQQKAQNIEQIKADIEKQAEERYNQRLTEISQGHELEADELGYIYSVKAGFDPNGCLAVMDILGRMPGAQLDAGSHPAPEKRGDKIKALMTEYPPETLKAEGKNLLSAKSTPLQYQTFSYQVEGGGTFAGLKVLPITGTTEDDLENYLK
ncbi:M48 family metalloprotease [Crocosphaera sp. XPORK-15E]|uniref:M48 family metalloprotease n=1 Tax=Crocosphaera sp. XPORK-15E TaxID=3110247 RepID=UPI002B1FFF96|nr:M48 family metalloprotease [Crocosphaera sp. XPORK-15E]MEA5533353.1 M48 family metalloprotease [Crocosphaera sp. XPORK-15E]